MTMELFLAVESAVPADHPAAMLAVPLGILFFMGSCYLLLWSNYGAKKGAAITGVAWFGFAALIGLFWWFGAPGIPAGLGISHLPGQGNDHYTERWFAFEAGSERAEYFPSVNNTGEFVPMSDYAGFAGVAEQEYLADPGYTNLAGSVSQALDRMNEQFLPIDENGVAQIGVTRRQELEEDAAANEPSDAARRNQPFYTARAVSDPRLIDDPSTGLRVATAEFQVFATFVAADGVSLDPAPVGEPQSWFAFYDPGRSWLPSALWTTIAGVLFLVSLGWLDRLEQREKREETDEVVEPEDLAVPIAQ
ncbi:MAG: hypothetical protein WD011_01075 [Nitriliruptoraceae bacterium]